MTLAMEHQAARCSKFNTKPDIQDAVRSVKNISEHIRYNKYKDFLNKPEHGFNIEEVVCLPFFSYDSYRYESELILIEEFLVLEIVFVLRHNGTRYFLCEEYDTIRYEETLNSIEIKKAT